jgi:triosephosphate isomerase
MTVLQKVIQWTIENAENIESVSGYTYIVIDHEEMRENFDKWIEEEKQQITDAVKYGFKYATCVNLDNSFDAYYEDTFDSALGNEA